MFISNKRLNITPSEHVLLASYLSFQAKATVSTPVSAAAVDSAANVMPTAFLGNYIGGSVLPPEHRLSRSLFFLPWNCG